jgi:hypothetical protein
MSARDAAKVTVTFDGTPIGGVEAFEFLQGQPREVTFRPHGAPAGIALPGQPDFGRCLLKIYRDKSDAGQGKLQSSLRNRETKTAVVTYPDGSTDTFRAFCLTLPIAGSKGSSNPVGLTICLLRISGPIT